MPKVVFHLKPNQVDKPLTVGHLELYGVISKMLQQLGSASERRVRDADIRIGTRSVMDGRFNDGNLHIIDDRHVRMDNVLNGARTYFEGYWHLDPEGTRFFSSIGQQEYRANMIPYKYARRFYQGLNRQFKEQRRSKYQQCKKQEDLPVGAVSVFLQGSYPRSAGATQWTDAEMLEDVLDGAGERPVLVKLHPRVVDLKTNTRILELAGQNRRVHLTEANIHDILAVSCASVSINSAVGIEGFLHRTPAILYGVSDFHHMAETIHAPGEFAGALERAQERTGGYAQYLTWYCRRQCLEIAAEDLEERIWQIFTRAGFPRERFKA